MAGVVMKTPGVYIVEKPAFPNSAVEVATAVPAFVGYTAKAEYKGNELGPVGNALPKAWRITSMAEFIDIFCDTDANGTPLLPPTNFAVQRKAPAAGAAAAVPAGSTPKFNFKEWEVTRQTGETQFLLFYSMLFFFQNGGGPCYIVSAGDYTGQIEKDKLVAGIKALEKEQEPTMIVVPDAVRLQEQDFKDVQTAALDQCAKLGSRFAILDVWAGDQDVLPNPLPAGADTTNTEPHTVTRFRSNIGINNLSYGAAYYPWLNTSILSDSDISYTNIAKNDLKALLTAENVVADLTGEIDNLQKYTPDLLNKTLMMKSPVYAQAVAEIKRQLNLLPPSPAVAGVYTTVDGTAGVWKAPANVSLNSVVSPTVTISDEDQENLNVDIQGKSINAIRSFIGEGVLVWGARTLDGNSLDWRYVGVRRTMIMLEQSIKLATKAYVFDNNVSTTWVTIKSMIRNFLTGIWKRGGLAGATPDDAFAVFCGLGETMTSEDILEGILRVTVLVAITRPAEFIEITFQQQMQKS